MRFCKSQPQISLLVPFREGNDPHRTEIWNWLKQFWDSTDLDCEIVVGTDSGIPFSKSCAVNNAAKKARGRIFVILDSDCYTNPETVQKCADAIEYSEKTARKLWFVPYLHLYRLTEEITLKFLESDPTLPYSMPIPPPEEWIEKGSTNQYGHRFGAMILIMSAEAFWSVGGMDPRFRGWGGEDVSFMRALDTLYGLHETVDNSIFHMWHKRPGINYLTRRWEGQRTYNVNIRLGQRYGLANGDNTFMKALVYEHHRPRWWKSLWRWIKRRVNCLLRRKK